MKRAVSLFLCAVLLLSSFVFFACDDESGNEHTHIYSDEWTKNKTEHWHICTVEGCAEISDKASHSWDSGNKSGETVIYTCTVCGEIKTEGAAPGKRTVTESEWSAALDLDNFTNFKVSGTAIDEGDPESFVLTVESADKGHYVSSNKNTEEYSWLENDVYRNYFYNSEAWTYRIEDSYGIYQYGVVLDIVELLQSAEYRDFTYSEETKLYTGDITFFDEDAECELGFLNGKLALCRITAETNSIDATFSSYGNATVQIPAIPEGDFSYESFLPFVTPPQLSSLSLTQSQVATAVYEQFYGYYKFEADSTQLTSGYVQRFDKVNIDFVGYLEGDSAPFEGGSASSYDLEIGSGNFIDGFEDGLIGAEIGDTVILDLTFPDDYGTSYVAGKAVRFYVTVNSITRYDFPEMTDAAVKDMGMGFETVAELETAVKGALAWEKFYKGSIYNELPYDEVNAKYIEVVDTYIDSAEQYGMNFEELLSNFGFGNVSYFSQNAVYFAESYVKEAVLVLAAVDQYSLSLDEGEMDAAILEYYNTAVDNGQFSGSYDDFISEYGRSEIELQIYYAILVEYIAVNVPVV